MDSLTLKLHNSFENQNNKTATNNFAPRRRIFKLQLYSSYMRELELFKN